MSPQSMSPEELRVAVAELRGYKRREWTDRRGRKCKGWISPGASPSSAHFVELPNCPGDLNAIHSAVIDLCDTEEKKFRYHRALSDVVGRGTPHFPGYNVWDAENATAEQRCRALLMTLGKDKEGV